ncbi:glycoside hydrolase family 5 protein [Streptomyces violens]|uniref:glycoside hydrolase family 5 protein n=1 Tax=Streptomyces violens TaxID=66377 RepID=UPI0009979123|nr:cellulase family glycosylhydrolase [Streptomyces violens]
MNGLWLRRAGRRLCLRRPAWRLAVALAIALPTVLAGCASTPAPTPTPHAAHDRAPRLHVQGNQLADQHGRTVVLRGVNRIGGEYACTKLGRLWDGPMDQASVTAMRRWGINAVRIPLNSACWNGASYVDDTVSGPAYRRAVRAYVELLDRNGLTPILDLHWTDGHYTGRDTQCTQLEAVCLKPMPDAAGAVPFWRSVAGTFKTNRAVVFDLFNEPYPDRALADPAAGWRCWRDGGAACAPGIPGYRAAGMQTLLDAVRSTGAANVVLAGGIAYANDLGEWLRYAPKDRRDNLAASWHAYDFSLCRTTACWDSDIAPVASKAPVVVTEIGQRGCRDTFLRPMLRHLATRAAGYLAWAWSTSGTCSSTPSLITDYNGTPTSYGLGLKQHLTDLTTPSTGAVRTRHGDSGLDRSNGGQVKLLSVRA